MPPRTHPSRSTFRQGSQPNIDPTLFGALSIADFRSLCLQHRIPSTVVRKTLERWLRDLNTKSRCVENIHEPAAQPGLQNNNETAAQRQDFTDDKMRTIQQFIKDTVQQSSQEIATEEVKAAVTAFQASSIASFLAPQPVSLVLGTESATSTAAVSFASPFQDIPAQYIKEIQSGEFFNLSKLLPKNLALYDDEDKFVLFLENSVVKVSKKTKAKAPNLITDIEQWTTAFTYYMRVLTQKYPTRSQKLLQRVSVVRYAVRVDKGLGWAIYDFKFRQKANVNKSID